MSGPPTEVELHGFVDGELEPARQAAVARLVAADPALAHRVAALRAEKMALADLLAPLLALSVPKRLEAAARQAPGRTIASRRRRAVVWTGMALAAGMALAVLLGPRRVDGPPGDPVVVQAEAARDGTMQPALEVTASGGDRMVAAALGSGVHVPDLGRVGFSLLSAERYAHAIQLRYRDRDGRLFTVFVRPGPGPDRFALTERHGTRFCVWENEDASVVMAGAMKVPELFRLSSLVYTALAL